MKAKEEFNIIVAGKDGVDLYNHFYRDQNIAKKLFDRGLSLTIPPFIYNGNDLNIKLIQYSETVEKALIWNYYREDYNLVALCFNPNNDQCIETLKKNYRAIERTDLKIICIYTEQPKNLANIVLAKIFAQENKISHLLSLDQFSALLIDLTEDQFNLIAVLETLNLEQYNQAFKNGSELYVTRNPSKSKVTTLFSFGSKNCQQKIIEQRMPVVTTTIGCFYGLYHFLKGEGTFNYNSYKRCVLEFLFPKLKTLPFEGFYAQVMLLEKMLTRTLDNKLATLQKGYKHIHVFATLSRNDQKSNTWLPKEINTLIKQKYVDLMIQEDPKTIEADICSSLKI